MVYTVEWRPVKTKPAEQSLYVSSILAGLLRIGVLYVNMLKPHRNWYDFKTTNRN